jgi:hypothetical protein
MATKAIVRYRYRPAPRRSHRKSHMTIPIAPIAGLMVGLVPAAKSLAAGNPEAAASGLVYRYTGYRTWDNKWSARGLSTGLLPLVIGGLVHKFVGGQLGINAALGRARFPLLRI